jgi:head-tail adaptor
VMLQERHGKGEETEEWREDARCVWSVLRGEEEREILRACGGEAMVKEE